jgi:hypothetical protein
MTGLWVALSVKKSPLEIRAALENWFPELTIQVWYPELIAQEPEDAHSSLQEAEITIHLDYNESEFPTVIHLDSFPGPQDETVIMPVIVTLARKFSDTFCCRAICDGSGYGDDTSPFWDIIWDKGKSFLADDCNTLFADQTSGAVKIVREISLLPFELDKFGRVYPRGRKTTLSNL